jgi:hypothetical protein
VQRPAVITRNDQQGSTAANGTKILDEVDTAHARHADIGNDQVVAVSAALRSASAGSLNSSICGLTTEKTGLTRDELAAR